MDLVGWFAAVLTTVCWLPQLRRSWRTRSTSDISWLYLVIFGTGITLWEIYGLARDDVPLIAANAVVLAALTALVIMKMVFERGSRRKAPEHVTAGGVTGP